MIHIIYHAQYSDIKRNAFESDKMRWMNLEPLMQSEVSQKEKNKYCILTHIDGFPGGSEVKSSVCNAGDLGSIPGSGRSPGEGNGNPLQYSCLENPRDGGASQATVHGVAKSQTQLRDFTFLYTHMNTLFYPTCTSILSYLLFSCSVVSDSLQPHGLQHSRLRSPSPSPRVC